MVDISHETPQQTASRLVGVIRAARLRIYEEPFAFAEFAPTAFPAGVHPGALALVRDDSVWSQLIPCDDPTAERFALCRFHFPAGADNSGFVGWLASHLKARFGTGVFVICGHNKDAGGVFDYWGVPMDLAAEVFAEIEALVKGERAESPAAPVGTGRL